MILVSLALLVLLMLLGSGVGSARLDQKRRPQRWDSHSVVNHRVLRSKRALRPLASLAESAQIDGICKRELRDAVAQDFRGRDASPVCTACFLGDGMKKDRTKKDRTSKLSGSSGDGYWYTWKATDDRLVLTLTPENASEVREMMKSPEWTRNYVNTFCSFLEAMEVEGWRFFDGEELGALTDAYPMLCLDWGIGKDDKPRPNKGARIYKFEAHQLRTEMSDLLEGKLVYQGHQ